MDSTATDTRVLRAIRRIIRAVDMHSRTLQQARDITSPQLACLLALARLGPLTLKALSQAIDLSPSTTVGIVDRLAAKGLVERARSRTDRRQVHVAATTAGLALAQQSPSPLQDGLLARLGALPAAEQLQLASTLERLAGLMGADAIDASALLDPAAIAKVTPASAPEREHPAARAAAPPSTPDAAGQDAAAPISNVAPPPPLPAPAGSPITRNTVITPWPRGET